jgi:hypothetical protein
VALDAILLGIADELADRSEVRDAAGQVPDHPWSTSARRRPGRADPFPVPSAGAGACATALCDGSSTDCTRMNATGIPPARSR